MAPTERSGSASPRTNVKGTDDTSAHVMVSLWSRESLVWRFGLIAAALLPIVIVFGILLRESRSVPFFDDYQAIVYFVLTLRALPTFGSKVLYILAAQHDEYKLIFEHAVVAAQYGLLGRLSFGFLIWFANTLLVGVGWVLWRGCFTWERDRTRRLMLFLPVLYLLFQLNYAENQDWAECGLQTFPVLLFSLGALLLLANLRSKAFIGACVFAVLACFSSANAFFLAPLGLFFLIPQRSRKRLIAWSGSFVLALMAYLYRYHRIFRADHDVYVSLGHKLQFFFCFLGAAAENQHHFPIRNGSLVLGLFLFGVFLHATWTGWYRENAFLYYAGAWFLLSAALVAAVRSQGGVVMSLTLRYKVYSDLLLIFSYVYGVSRVRAARPNTWVLSRARTWYAAALAFAVLLSLSSDVFGYKFLAKRQARVEEGFREYLADPTHNPPMISTNGEAITTTEPEFTRVVLTEALRTGVYTLPSAK